MSFFQNAVITKYAKALNNLAVEAAYARFVAHFHNPVIQENIRNSKEEQYQGEFLIDLFVNVLGYVKNPAANFNLTTEYKNVKDSKKADGAIILNESVRAVIELKGTESADLGKFENQAFGYKNNQEGCTYVVISNFEKLRFYIDNAIEHIEFNLFKLRREEFNLLYLCLAYECLSLDIPKKIKEDSLSQEDAVTKKLYKDYSFFKRELHQNLVLLNPQFDPLVLFKKSQKLLDRFLFLFFAEDRLLLPPNSVRLILADWKDLQDRDVDVPLFDRFKKYFGYLNTGYKGKRYDVFAYNGGLFAPDEILDHVIIDDELLYRHTYKLSEYDFISEVDVNILGHIFENSLNELDEIKAQLEGHAVEKSKTKRKTDGVFYTPKFITKYIVDNTVGKLCLDKKAEIQLTDSEYTSGLARSKSTTQALFDKLSSYRSWLLQLTICDPACGSGAFLNQALDFLIAEHHYIDELQAKLFGDAMVLSDIEKSILENNLFGVDLNEESVEIARLSLWLRTAQPNRKLNDLSHNIKCGNSLIDDPAVAGDKAFNWQKEFPQIFEKGGFDVVIGNPPYVSNWTLSETDRDTVKWLNIRFEKDLTGHWDLFICFISIGLDILRTGGYNSFILPTSFLKEKYGRMMRDKLIQNYRLLEIVDFGQEVVFENVARQTFIYTLQKSLPLNNYINIKNGIIDCGTAVPQLFYLQLKNAAFKTNVTEYDIHIYNKLINNSINLGDLVCINVGVVAHSNTSSPIKFTKDDVIYDHFIDGYKKYITGSNLKRYSLNFDNKYIDYDSNVDYFHRPKFKLLFENEKIIVRRTSGNNNSIIAFYDIDHYYSNDNLLHLIKWTKDVLNYQKPENKWNIIVDNDFNMKYLLSLICSKLHTYYFSKFLSTDTLQGAYSSIYPEDLRVFPIKNIIPQYQEYFITKTDVMLALNNDLQKGTHIFQRTIQRKFNIPDLTTKLQNWHQLTFPEFLKELTIKKVKFSLSQEAEWESYFMEESAKANTLKKQIEETDREIDRMVYELYGLTEEEIGIVEGKIN